MNIRFVDLVNSLILDFKSKRSALLSTLNLMFLTIGMYGSLKVVMSLYGTDCDTSHSLMLWLGVKEHGVSWIQDWIFTQDNWLLSLAPIHFAGFLIFGPSAVVALIFGWLIYILSALVAGAIAWSLGAKKGSLFIFISLLNLSLYAHEQGKVSHSTSHNITNLYGLTSILVLINWSSKPSNSFLVLLLAVLTCGAVSDPWMLPAYNLPIILVGLWFLAKPTKAIDRRQSIKLISVSGISILAVKTKLFGILWFIPSMSFSPANWQTAIANSYYLTKDLGGLLNIFPFTGINEFLPGLISLLIVMSLMIFNIYRSISSQKTYDQKLPTFLLVYLLSAAGISLAFTISSVEANDSSARFLISIVYLIVIATGVFADFNWKRSSNAYRYTLITFLGLFLTAGFFSNLNRISNCNFNFKDIGVPEMISFLNDHHLTYGYGPYWGANANAVTAESNDLIRIRPVQFNKENGMITYNRVESSKRWYTPEDIPAGVREFFVIVKSDGEECPDVKVCINGLIKQFGQTVHTYENKHSTVLVWDHQLFGYQTPVERL